MNIEVELRTFITKEQYEQLLTFFHNNAQFISDDDQETFYFNGPHDLRIQRNNFYAKIWMKKGKLHDNYREEIEIKFDRAQFETLEQLFMSLGFEVRIKWFRKRSQFHWKEITICLDYTKGYGYIIELEKMSTENDKHHDWEQLKQKLTELYLPITSKEEFDQKFNHYKQHWKSLIGEL